MKRAFFNTPRDMVEGARELSAQSDKVMAAVAALHAASERDQQQQTATRCSTCPRCRVAAIPTIPRMGPHSLPKWAPNAIPCRTILI